jgi:hypothetical protein
MSSALRIRSQQPARTERGGFEPPRQLMAVYTISSRAPSAGLGHLSYCILGPLRFCYAKSSNAPKPHARPGKARSSLSLLNKTDFINGKI